MCSRAGLQRGAAGARARTCRLRAAPPGTMSAAHARAAPGTSSQSPSARRQQALHSGEAQRAHRRASRQHCLPEEGTGATTGRPPGLTITATRAAASFRPPGSLMPHGACRRAPGRWAACVTDRRPSASASSTAKAATHSALAIAGRDRSVAVLQVHKLIAAQARVACSI